MLGGGGEEGGGQEEVFNDASQAGEGDGHSKQEGQRWDEIDLSNRRWRGAEKEGQFSQDFKIHLV